MPLGDRAARPRLGFLGAGWIGRNRLEAIAKSGVAEIAAVADPSSEAAARAREIVPGVQITGTFEDLLGCNLDGVVIATPSALHAEQSIAALQRGIAVFCQKPLARDATETRQVIDAARHAGRLLGVDLSYRFTTAMRRIRDLVRAGELGQVFGVDVVFHNAYGPDKAWFYDPTLAGGGCVIDLGIHLVDLALWCLDFPAVTRVSSRLWAQGRPLSADDRLQHVEDYAMARIDLANGASVQLACSWKLPAGCDAVIRATLFGTRGGASMHNVNGSFSDFAADAFRGTQREPLASPPDNWTGRAAVDWATRLAAGARFDPEVEHLSQVAETLDEIYRSAVP